LVLACTYTIHELYLFEKAFVTSRGQLAKISLSSFQYQPDTLSFRAKKNMRAEEHGFQAIFPIENLQILEEYRYFL